MSSIERIDTLEKKIKPETEDLTEERIKQIVRKFVFDEKFALKEDGILVEIIKLIKCDLKTAKAIFQKMKDLGLEVCTMMHSEFSIEKFAEIRGYVSNEELKKLSKEIKEREKKFDKEYKETENLFIEKHGPMSKWSEEVWDEYVNIDE